MDYKPEQLKKLDPSDMYTRIYNFPEQLQEGFNLPINGDLSMVAPEGIDEIVIAGMGGSAIGGDFLRSYLAYDVKIPIQINRNYSLPKLVDENTFFVASSYSGNTEETLAAFAEARERNCKIFVATTGGTLGEAAKQYGYPHVVLPPGYEPRAALGYSFGPLLRLMEQVGFVSDQTQHVNDACDFLKENRKKMAQSVATGRNAAKKLADSLKDKIVIVYAGPDYYDTAAIRFKGQICENAKQLAYANICPEFNHNELVGFEFPSKQLSKLVVIFLTGPADSKGVTNRFKIINKIMKEKGIETFFLAAGGPNRLAEMMSLVQIGDMMSYYLALINKTDPSPVHVINRLKGALEKINQ